MAGANAIDIVKLRVKIDAHEFEAEGPSQAVGAHFAVWQRLIAAHSANGTAAALPAVAATATSPAPANREIFSVDPRTDLLALTVKPTGKTFEADAILLLLYGHQQRLGAEGQQVRGTRLKKSWTASGLRHTRLDRLLANHVHNRLIKKTGARKSSTYRLTDEGTERAAVMAADLRQTA